MLTAIGRIGSTAWKNFWRNGYLTLATLGVMGLTLFVVTSLALLSVIAEVALERIQDQIDISIYFEQDVPESEIRLAREKIDDFPEVKEVTYVSSQEAFQRFKERHKDNPILIQSLEELGENPLEAALNIKAAEASQFPAIAAFIEQNINTEIVDKVNYHQNENIISRLSALVSASRKAGTVAIIVLAAIAILVTFNTIRLAIYTAREEIGVMRLVGASNWFIRGPFLTTGVLHGVVAGAITFIGMYPLIRLASPRLDVFLSGFDLLAYYHANALQLLFLQIGVGVMLGALSSAIAIRRHLRV